MAVTGGLVADDLRMRPSGLVLAKPFMIPAGALETAAPKPPGGGMKAGLFAGIMRGPVCSLGDKP